MLQTTDIRCEEAGKENEMLIKVTGKEETLEKLEKAQKLIDEAGKILWSLPSGMGIDIREEENEEKHENS